MAQLPLKLVHESSYTRENFVISDANREAFSWVEQWPHWPNHALIIYGEKGCGKTHLAHIWREKTGAQWISESAVPAKEKSCFVLENIENIRDETGLFHLFNRVKEQEGHLLMTSSLPPAKLPFRLPDLTSRLQGTQAVAVQAPDDNLLKSILLKSFSDKQLKINSEVIDYIIPRMERSFAAIQELVRKLDSRALEEQRNITVPLVREVMEKDRIENHESRIEK